MKDKICVTIGKDHIYTCDTKTIGRVGENISTEIELTLDESFSDKRVFLEFERPDGEKVLTPQLTVTNNKASYNITNYLLDKCGDLKVDVILNDTTGWSWKTNIKTYQVRKSVNASEVIPNKEDFITEAQNVLDDIEELKEEVEEGLTPTIGENGNWYILDVDTGKPSRGESGEGVPVGGTTGQVLKKKSNTDYDTEWKDDESGVADFDELENRPKYNGTTMSSSTNIPEVKTDTWDGKQDAINDLATIRSGAASGSTAVQDNSYVHTDNNYTTSEKNKLAGLSNYDDTEVRGLIANKQDIIQYSTMPTATSGNVGKIVEYIGTTDSNYTNGYFYKCVDTSVQESITANQTDNVVPLGTITVDNSTFKSQASAGTHEFVYRPYDTVLNFSNISVFPPVMIQVTRDSTFDRSPMIPNAPRMYSWVDNSNNFYVTNTLKPNALTKLYLLDIQTNEATDTGTTFISSNTPSQIEGRWTKKDGDVYTDVEISDYGIYLTSSGLPGNTIQVTYVEANTSYSWVQHNVQPQTDISGKQDKTDNDLVTTSKTVVGAISELNTRIGNLQNIGRFLSIWDCTTGLPTSNPSSLPYSYKTGDYYRVGVVGTTNYMPNGSSYTGTASTTQYTGTGLSIGAVFYYDGTQWKIQASGGGGTVQDVQINGATILSGGIANIQLDTSISSSSTNTKGVTPKAVYDYVQSLDATEVSY